MLLALALFFAGMAEYGLAAYWTHVFVLKHAGKTAAATFLSVMLWGFVVTNLRVSEPRLLIVHGLGCALGAAITCWMTKPACPEAAASAAPKEAGEAELAVANAAR